MNCPSCGRALTKVLDQAKPASRPPQVSETRIPAPATPPPTYNSHRNPGASVAQSWNERRRREPRDGNPGPDSDTLFHHGPGREHRGPDPACPDCARFHEAILEGRVLTPKREPST